MKIFRNCRSAAIVFTCVAAAGCGDDNGSPTSPSPAQASVQEVRRSECNSNQAICVDIRRYTASAITIQISGELNYGLRTQTDPNGANVRVRVYDGSAFKTYIVGVFNSSPIGNTNVTIIRDIPVPASNRIDMAFYLEPIDCRSGPSCWNPFVFERENNTGLYPWDQYRVRKVGDEVRLQGDVPRVEGS